MKFVETVKGTEEALSDPESEFSKVAAGTAVSKLFWDEQILANKVKQFLDQLDSWRTEARQGSLADLIWRIYLETKYFDFVGGLPGGLQRQANLRALYDRARQYESTSFRGLFRFLRFIERMKDMGIDLGAARAIGEQEDVVRIMSIHRSKGLEFPVVFVAGLTKKFNQQDLKNNVLIDKKLGFGPKFVNPDLRLSYPTLPNLAIKRKMRKELVAEELRVLYVALIRAKEKLSLVGAVTQLDKRILQWSKHFGYRDVMLPDYDLAKANSYLDWIGAALIRHSDAEVLRERVGAIKVLDDPTIPDPSRWKILIKAPTELHVEEVGSTIVSTVNREEAIEALNTLQPVLSTGAWEPAIKDRLGWGYAYS
jgi:ATP-dependent helicase/nuclease subunit A